MLPLTQIITPLIGRHNVYNILAAVAVGLAVTVNGEPIPLKVWPTEYITIFSFTQPEAHSITMLPLMQHEAQSSESTLEGLVYVLIDALHCADHRTGH